MDRVKVEQEFIFKASPTIVYQFLTTPACLVRWFCDAVDIQDDIYTFEWDGAPEEAEMIDDIEDERIRYHWEDGEEGEYFEYRMYKSDVTNETILEITDWCDAGDEQSHKDLWSSQIDKMRFACGG